MNLPRWARLTVTVLAMGLSGCSARVAMPSYQPKSEAVVEGELSVGDFPYALAPKLPPLAINNTAAGTIYLTQPISEHVAQAVRQELLQAGLKVRPGFKCTIDGVIQDLTLDDLGYSVDYTTVLDFRLTDGASDLYRKTTSEKKNGSKFVDAASVLAVVNEMLGRAIDQVLTDPDFGSAVAEKC
jgi:hypothetical protein